MPVLHRARRPGGYFARLGRKAGARRDTPVLPRADRDDRARRSGAGHADADHRYDAARTIPAGLRGDARRRGKCAGAARAVLGAGQADRARRPAGGDQERPDDPRGPRVLRDLRPSRLAGAIHQQRHRRRP